MARLAIILITLAAFSFNATAQSKRAALSLKDARPRAAQEATPAPSVNELRESDILVIVRELVSALKDSNATTQMALARLPVGGVVIQQAAPQQAVHSPAPAPEVSPIAKACGDSILSISCGVQFLASMGSGAVDFVKALVPVGGQVISYHTAKRQYEYQAIAAKEATIQHGQAQVTLQTAFNAQRDVANKDRPPGQVVTFSDSYGINFGNGTQTWTPVTDSNNPINPNPLVCVPTFAAAGGINGYSCTR
jgi:hypothetical protein